jgi:hypothetical protein
MTRANAILNGTGSRRPKLLKWSLGAKSTKGKNDSPYRILFVWLEDMQHSLDRYHPVKLNFPTPTTVFATFYDSELAVPPTVRAKSHMNGAGGVQFYISPRKHPFLWDLPPVRHIHGRFTLIDEQEMIFKFNLTTLATPSEAEIIPISGIAKLSMPDRTSIQTEHPLRHVIGSAGFRITTIIEKT